MVVVRCADADGLDFGVGEDFGRGGDGLAEAEASGHGAGAFGNDVAGCDQIDVLVEEEGLGVGGADDAAADDGDTNGFHGN